MANYKRFGLKETDDVLVIELADPRLFDALAISELEEELLALISERSPQKLIVDFQPVAHCSTSVINGLLRAKKKMMPSGGRLKLCSMRDTVREAYRILNLEGTVFDIYPDQPSALASFQSS